MTAALVFSEELASGALDAGALDSAEVRAAVRWSGRRSRPVRAAHRVRHRAGLLTHRQRYADPAAALRRSLGCGDTRPRLLLRVDEFPHARAFDSAVHTADRYREFHSILAEAGVPYLVAVVPFPSRDYLDPRAGGCRALDAAERLLLRDLAGDGVGFGLHALTHRTRYRSPRRHSELNGLDASALAAHLDVGIAVVEEATGERPRVLVPPFNRFDPRRLAVVAERFTVITGGPESIALVGLSPTPAWLDHVAYLPAYPPLYGTAAEVAAGLRDLAGSGIGGWAPAVLHWGWELDDGWRGLRAALDTLAEFAVPWSGLLDVVDATRQTDGNDSPDG